MTDPKPTLAELELREQLYNAMDGNLRMSHRRKLLNAYRDAILASVLPPAEGPEYTPCVACGHIEPEHRPDAGPCLMCGCTTYRPGQLEPAVVEPPADRAALERVRAVLETEAVVGRSALEYRGLIASALMADETPATKAHACRNCEGIDPGTCLTNPDRTAAAGARQDGAQS